MANEPFLAVVADGLGGHPGGDLASRLAVEYLMSARPSTGDELVVAVHGANELLVGSMSADDGSVGMGTTLAAALVNGSIVTVVNVGDSPVFGVSDDGMEQLSIDDVPFSTAAGPDRLSALVTQTLGGSDELEAISPHVYVSDIGSCRRILLCTDGLTSFVPLGQIAAELARHEGATAIEVLVALALAAGAPDNVTAVLLDTEP